MSETCKMSEAASPLEVGPRQGFYETAGALTMREEKRVGLTDAPPASNY